MPTICKACDNVHSATRSQEPWKWRCIKAPIEPGFGFVDPDFSPTPPYERCSKFNPTGECPEFTPIRKPLGE